MKKLLSIVTAMLVIASGYTQAQQAVYKEINQLKASGAVPKKMQIVKFLSTDVHQRDYNLQGLSKGTIISLSKDEIEALMLNRNDFIQIQLPVDDRSEMALTLKRQEIFTSDFTLYESSHPRTPVSYTPGVHYKGIVDGEPTSVVAVSVFNDQVTGLIATDQGNFVIGQIKDDPENRHIFYNDKDLDTSFEFECGTPDDGLGYTKEQLSSQPGSRDPGDCIRVYVEIDDNIVTDMGGAANALSFVTSIFNQTITLYANEGITMSISEILVWTTTSPYNGTTGGEQLTSFQQNTGSINGDLGHLVSFQPMGQGVAASHSGICNSNSDLSKCFSGIFPVYQVFPAWSWSVNVTTHEMGHLIGSRHTHACVWNFNNTAIDGCSGVVEGNCPLPGIPAEGGTIMSYCHNQSVGTKFNLGFGSQPGNVIRNTVRTLGNCLSTSCTPAEPEYCWAAGGHHQQGQAFWIQSVTLGSINNISGNSGGYADFTALSTTLNADSTYTIAMTAANEGVNFAKAWGVYIDYNHDRDFYDEGEQVAGGDGSLSVNFTFTVPASSPSVTTRMRVTMRRKDSGTTQPCGFSNYGEVEDYTIVIDASSGPACDDGVQNGDETGVDCGGGTCPICPTCTDGIENSDEEGVDCGGSCPDACPGTVLFGHFFETGWDGWTDGGEDANLYSGNYSWEGNYSINLQDNSAVSSAMTSPAVDLTGFTSVQLDFYFYATSMESGEDFLVSYYDGSSYTTIATYISGYGGHFANNSFWAGSVILTNSQVNFASNARFRIQCDASDNNDDIYIDAVTLTTYGYNPPCPDADNDNVCDSLDVCPGFNDNLIGTPCDDGDECTENDIYLGAPDCNCAGTPIPDCVPCNPQTASLTPNPLTHIGTGVSSTNVLSLPTGSSDVEFTISGLNAKLNGANNGRFIDRAKVWYDDGSSAQLYGTFNGDQVSTANVSITGLVQSVWITLEDGYDGNSGVTQNISFSQVTHCTTPPAPIQGGGENAFKKIETRSVGSVLTSDTLQVYPNPVSDMLQIDFRGTIDEIRIVSAQGLAIRSFETGADFREISIEQLPAGIYVLMIRNEGSWVTKKFIKL